MRSDDEYFNDEEFLEILNDYEKSAKSGQTPLMDADDLVDIAEYYLSTERYDEAQDAIERALETDPHSLSVLNYQIHEALHEGNIEAAQQYLDSIMEQESPEYIYSRAEILIAQDKVDEADLFLRQQLQDVPPDEYQDYVLDVANIYTDYGLNEKAMEWMMRARQDNTDDFKELMARTLFGLGKYKDSERIFNELIDHDPYSTRYWNALASAQFMQEDYSSAITSSEYAIAIDPNDAEGLLSKANSLYNLENFETALSYFQKYSEKMPDDEFGFLHQGTCLINLARYDEAIAVLEKAEELADPESQYLPEVYQEMAFAYSEQGKPDTAIYYLDKTDNLDCDHINMQIIKGHVLLANKRLKEAENTFKEALKASGNSPKIMLRIIVSLYDNRYLRSSYMLLKNFFSYMDDEWKDGYAYMALCCLDMKKDDEFLYYLKLACEKNPKEARIVLGGYFPKGTEPKDYYEYMINKLKKK